MKHIELDEQWEFRRGFLDAVGQLAEVPAEKVNLPHDGMIGTPVSPDAPARADSGYFTGGITNYTKHVLFPAEWKTECVGLQFDGVMMNASVEVNGSLAARHHYGYAPFYVDLTSRVTFGEENRITVHTNTSMQPNSRWYTGSGLYRGVRLLHGPRVHIVPDSVFVRTKELADGCAFLEARVEVENATLENRLAEVTVTLAEEDSDREAARARGVIYIGAGGKETARIAFRAEKPKLWSAEEPNLYRVHASARDLGEYRTHFEPSPEGTADEETVLFGIRTITADAVRGLRINGREVKLKGGCLHHDNGLLGAVSLYETEARKIRKLKEAGFNAIRTAHNPPSSALIEACDRLGMYVFDEAFDCWNMAKRGGDFSQHFAEHGEEDLQAFVRRDRSHPSVILWSTGNEIPERGGLSDGYTVAARLAETVRRLDGSRPVSNGICSMWSGLDDALAVTQAQEQNSGAGFGSTLWEKVTEPFANGLDVVGYNYMEELYERDHEMFPDRVILGSENFPKEIGYRWPFVESHSYVIGDFTWTAWDYIGEAGIGKAAYVDPEDPLAKKGHWALMPQYASPFPWRTANDADFDITGQMLPQGVYRSIVWGNPRTGLFSLPPETWHKTEIITMWGFPGVRAEWTYPGSEGKPVELVVFSGAEEVELLVNGRSAGRKKVCFEKPLPCSVRFETVYEPGTVEAVSYRNGKEVSRDRLTTAGEPAAIELIPEKKTMQADGHDLIYVQAVIRDRNGTVVPNALVRLTAEVTGCASLAAFGSGNPVTDENYTDCRTVSYRGRAMAILRSGKEKGPVCLRVTAEGLPAAEVKDLSAE
ncbi:MAG: DUF4982 domain-containing protein [Clostridia bacterium]|nr:DUF4982 domain-containing protein [Clostridia bacterium]